MAISSSGLWYLILAYETEFYWLFEINFTHTTWSCDSQSSNKSSYKQVNLKFKTRFSNIPLLLTACQSLFATMSFLNRRSILKDIIHNIVMEIKRKEKKNKIFEDSPFLFEDTFKWYDTETGIGRKLKQVACHFV